MFNNRKVKHFRSRSHSYGFTLVEVLLAIFITSIVLSIIYVSYTGSLRVINSSEKQTEIYRKARIALERMVEDLESVYLAVPEQVSMDSGWDFLLKGEKKELAERRADTLSFVSRSHISFSDDKPAYVKTEILYDVTERSEDGPLVLTRSDRPTLYKHQGEISERYDLCEGLEAVTFSYRDKEGEVYEAWDPTGYELSDKPLDERLPALVTINLSFKNELDPEEPMTFSTSVVLPAGVE